MSVVRLGRALRRRTSLGVVLAASALVAAVVVPSVRAHALAVPPTNTTPPKLVVSPGIGSTATLTPGSWSGSPTSFTYQYLRCPDGGGAANGSNCTAVGPATSTPEPHPILRPDMGFTLRVRVTATNSSGSTSAVSAASGTAADMGVANVTGCPSVQQGSAPLYELKPPARLEIDRHTVTPRVITPSTQVVTLRIEVVACDDQYVPGALVYATPTPYQQFGGAESATNDIGWATITLRRQRYFPATPQQQNLVVFVRARKPGEPLLGGISGRRLISLPVRLR